MEEGNSPVLAVYDFRSKQEFIYRTNRMREITGASELIACMYAEFLEGTVVGRRIRNDWRDSQPQPLLDSAGNPVFSDDEIGVVVYEGGGNLLVLYRDREAFKEANRTFSNRVIEKGYSLSMVCAASEWRGDKGFEWNRTQAYRQFDRAKRLGCPTVPCNVLPYTQVDRVTFQPIVKKDDYDYGDVTQEGMAKRAAFDALPGKRKSQGRFIDDLGTEKGRDSLIAVLYFDGNSIGERVRSAVEEGASSGKTEVEAMREFSKGLHETMVDRTRAFMVDAIANLPEEYQGHRVIIDHGDEITLVCNAHAAPFALDAYFSALEGSGYHACGGMAICHSHDPFAQVYRIAEECCESGKRANRVAQKLAMEGLSGQAAIQAARDADADYVDFHFCRSGITGTLEQIRSAQEGGLVGRPYRAGEGQSYSTFMRVGELLAASGPIKRTDIKELNRAMLRGWSWYALEYERIKAKDGATMCNIERACGAVEGAAAGTRRRLAATYLFDVTSLYDVFAQRFGAKFGEEEDDGQKTQ